MFEDVVATRDRLAELVDRLDPDRCTGPAARELWRVFDSAERLCAAGKTLLARRLAETHQRTSGTRSAAEELAHTAGTSTGQAEDTLRTSQRLPDQRRVEQALRRGELSAPQAALISGAAAADPAQADRLVDAAQRMSLPELREECARVRAAADPDPAATNRRVHEQRRLRRWTDSDGFWNLHAKGTPQAGAAFAAVLEAFTDQVFTNARRAGQQEPYEAYAFDALMAIGDSAVHPNRQNAAAREPASAPESAVRESTPQTSDPTVPQTLDDAVMALAADGASAADRRGGPDRPDEGESDERLQSDPWSGIDQPDRPEHLDQSTPPASAPPVSTPPESALPASAPPGHRNGPTGPLGLGRGLQSRYLALLRIDVEALHRGRVAGDEICEIRGVGPVPVPVAEGLLGQSVLKLVITRGVDVLNVTHLGRGPTAAQKVALAWTTPGCTAEGCYRSRIEHDHRQPWADTQHTRLDELDPLCGYHHDLKTHHHWVLLPGSGKRPMVGPNDPRHPGHRNTPPARRTPNTASAAPNAPPADAA
jgi:hypothetical protein